MCFVNGDVKESVEYNGEVIMRRYVMLRCIKILDEKSEKHVLRSVLPSQNGATNHRKANGLNFG